MWILCVISLYSSWQQHDIHSMEFISRERFPFCLRNKAKQHFHVTRMRFLCRLYVGLSHEFRRRHSPPTQTGKSQHELRTSSIALSFHFLEDDRWHSLWQWRPLDLIGICLCSIFIVMKVSKVFGEWICIFSEFKSQCNMDWSKTPLVEWLFNTPSHRRDAMGKYRTIRRAFHASFEFMLRIIGDCWMEKGFIMSKRAETLKNTINSSMHRWFKSLPRSVWCAMQSSSQSYCMMYVCMFYVLMIMRWFTVNKLMVWIPVSWKKTSHVSYFVTSKWICFN